MASILTYATFMDPRIAMRYNMLERNIVWVNGYQRFFGLADSTLVGKTLEEITDADGKITEPCAATTVEASPNFRFNGVIYTSVSESALHYLDNVEAQSGLMRVEISKEHITDFGTNLQLGLSEDRLFAYAALTERIKPDIIPNTGYLYKCREAARVHGDAFRKAYEETTFLADRKTALKGCGF